MNEPKSIPLKERTLTEMIRYAAGEISEMKIPPADRATILGMIEAIRQKAKSVCTEANADPCIRIEYGDSPIAAACKLATATRPVKAGPFAKAVRTVLGAEPEEEYPADVFTCDELRELAEHLTTYANHNENLEDTL